MKADTPIPQSDQARFWTEWNAKHREVIVGPISQRQAAILEAWIAALNRRDLSIVDVGCGSGWLCERLLPFGRVTGVDLAGEVIERARHRVPDATFLAGDFMGMTLPKGTADVIVTLEVLSHIADQAAFIAKLAGMLRPGGYLMMATQNRFVLERNAEITPRDPRQIRRWVDHRELRRLLAPHFKTIQLTSLFPNWGHGGILRILNSPKLNSLAGRIVPTACLDQLKERLFLGHTLMALAHRKP